MTKIEDYGEVEVPGLLLEAAGDGPRPGILLLQEIFGVNASIRATAKSFRDRGYDVFVPDLFWRQAPGIDLDPASADDRSKAEVLMKGLDERVAIADIGMGARRLRRLGRGAGRIAAVGYCLGGRLAYLAAAAGLVDAAVSYYGVAIHRSLDLADRIEVPMLLHIAGADHLCDGAAQADLYLALASRPNFSLHTHTGVGHAFARPNGTQHDEAATIRANHLTSRFLHTTIGTGVGHE